MKITRDEVEKLLATMYKFKATEVELDIDYFGSSVDYLDFDIWKNGHYFCTVFTIEKERGKKND